MAVDDRTRVLIRRRSFPGAPAQPASGEIALEAMLEDDTIPELTAWMVDATPEIATVYLLAGAALYRLIVPAAPGALEDPSHCTCELIPIGCHASFSLALNSTLPMTGSPTDREVVRTWTFSPGTGEPPFDVKTGGVIDTQEPERDEFARALASALGEAKSG
jgi:hypothetical protein